MVLGGSINYIIIVAMNKDKKELIQLCTACLMLVFSIFLTTFGFFVAPTGIVHDSVLWVMGQCLLYSGAIFGVSTYTKSRMDEIRDEVKKIKDKENKE